MTELRYRLKEPWTSGVCTTVKNMYWLHVVDGSAKPLLSADTCELFGLPCHVQQAQLCNTLESFADVFQGLGCLPEYYHIEVDPDVRPVQHMSLKVPVRVPQELRQRLQELVNMKVISPVKEPIKWINSMVIVKKPNKLCICLDLKDLNKAIKRPHCPIPGVCNRRPAGHNLARQAI